MRLQQLDLTNFRGFSEYSARFHPEFNVIIGANGTGKTSVLEGAAIALGAWLQGFPNTDARNIRPRDVRRVQREFGERLRILSQYPVAVSAMAKLEINEKSENSDIVWTRTLERSGGRTTQMGSRQVKNITLGLAKAIRDGETVTLPVLRYFGAGRLWENARVPYARKRPNIQRQMAEAKDDQNSEIAEKYSNPFYGYRMSIDKHASPGNLIRWIGEERRNEIDLDRPSTALRLVYNTILNMLPELSDVRYELRQRSLVIEQNNQAHLFEDMSDGYRNIIAMAADLAIKMTMLNPHLRLDALKETPGVVLIDELDLHLHPTWQRRVAEDLRRTFPRVQFICTTHSPFIVQSLRSGDELMVLDGQPTANTANMTLEEVVQGLMGVGNAEVGERYSEMKNTARNFLERMEKADLSSEEKFLLFQKQLAEDSSPFADNPAYQAFLEMKLAKHYPGDDK